MINSVRHICPVNAIKRIVSSFEASITDCLDNNASLSGKSTLSSPFTFWPNQVAPLALRARETSV